MCTMAHVNDACGVRVGPVRGLAEKARGLAEPGCRVAHVANPHRDVRVEIGVPVHDIQKASRARASSACLSASAGAA